MARVAAGKEGSIAPEANRPYGHSTTPYSSPDTQSIVNLNAATQTAGSDEKQ